MNTLSPDQNRPPYRKADDVCTQCGKLMAFAVAAVVLAIIIAFSCEWIRVSYDRYATLNQIMNVISQFRAGIPPAYEGYLMTAGSCMFVGVAALISCIAFYSRKRSVGIVFVIVSLLFGLMTSYGALQSLEEASSNHSSPNATHILIVLLVLASLVCSVMALVRLLKAGVTMGAGAPAGSGAACDVTAGVEGGNAVVGEGNACVGVPTLNPLFKWCLILSPFAAIGILSAIWAIMVYMALQNYKVLRDSLMVPLCALAVLPLIANVHNSAIAIICLLLTGAAVVYFYETYYKFICKPGKLAGRSKLMYGAAIVCILLKAVAAVPAVRTDYYMPLYFSFAIFFDYVVWYTASYLYAKGIGKLVVAVE